LDSSAGFTTTVDAANTRLAAQVQLLTLVNSTRGDLAALNRLSGGATYHVQIAADSSKRVVFLAAESAFCSIALSQYYRELLRIPETRKS
jgi:hypothetical protein